MIVDGLIVTETIKGVQKFADKEPLSDPAKSKIKDLILVASIMKDHLSTSSKNSSQPPSKDELKDKKDNSGSNLRKPGGQKNLQGNQSKPVQDPDEIVDIPIDQSQLPDGHYTSPGYESRQVIDLGLFRHVIEYRAEIVGNDFGQEYRDNFPGKVTRPVQ